MSGATDESPHEYFYFFAGRGRQHQTRLQGIRKGRYKLRLSSAADGELVAGELYDLYADAAEKFDISSRHSDLVRQLLAQARAFLAELGQSTRPLGGT